MRWNALVLGMLVVGLGFVGCVKPENDLDEAQSVDAYDYAMPLHYESPQPPVEGAAAGEDSYEAYAGVASPEADSTPIGSSRYHVVVKGDTLYSLARAYYDDQRRWKDIYQANQSVIADPDLILVGQQLMIP